MVACCGGPVRTAQTSVSPKVLVATRACTCLLCSRLTWRARLPGLPADRGVSSQKCTRTELWWWWWWWWWWCCCCCCAFIGKSLGGGQGVPGALKDALREGPLQEGIEVRSPGPDHGVAGSMELLSPWDC
eukprot:1159130-Pelagomonas_calceolata.AAC.3